MRAIEFIFESYPLAKKEFSQMANPDVVQTTIDQYRELVRKNQFRNPDEKNINHWRRLGWEAFSQMVKVKSNDVTDTQRKRGKVVGNAITLQDDTEWTVLIPLDKDTSVHYGRGTEWCTTKPYWSYFESYVYNRNITLIYAIDKTKSGKSVAISIEPDDGSGEKIEMFNQNDDGISATKYKEISGLDSEKFIQLAKLPENQQLRTASREKYNVARAKTAELLAASPLDPEAIERELKFTKDTDGCYNYIMLYSQEQNSRVQVHPSIVAAVSNHDTSKKKNNVGQSIDFTNIPIGILRSISRTTPDFIIYNATALSPNQQIVIREYEESIKDDPHKSYNYADKTNKPFPAGEAAIIKDKDWSYEYVSTVLRNHRSLSWEQLIKDDPKKSLDYAKERNEPFPAGESAIASDIQTSIPYIVRLADKSHTWENIIKDNPKIALCYAIILKKRFPAGEAAIASDPEHAAEYDQMFGTNLAQQ